MCSKQLIYRRFFKKMDAQNLYGSVERAWEVELFVKDGDDEINRQGNPDMGFHGIGSVAVEMFDAQVLFDPAEEKFDASAQAVERGNDQGRHGQVVGQENQIAVVFFVEVTDTAKRHREIDASIWQGGPANLVAANATVWLHRAGVKAGETQKQKDPYRF
jgi:hypothetical protein